jgi:hypothetical protein
VQGGRPIRNIASRNRIATTSQEGWCSFVVEASGRLGPAANGEVVAECEITEVAKKAAVSRILRAIGIEIMRKQVYTMATLIQERKNEEQSVADFARVAVRRQSCLDGRQRFI